MKDEIDDKQWLNECTELKKVDKTNPFGVPVNYFEDLEQQVIATISLDKYKSASLQGGFIVPDNYFTQLEGQLIAAISLEKYKGANLQAGFVVPEGYFNELEQQTNSIAAVTASHQPTDEAFAVPENYFDTLEQQIQSRIYVESALAKEQSGFEVPANYFESLSARITDQTTQLDTIQKRGIVRKLFASAAFKYASAACFAIIIGVGVYINMYPVNTSQHSHLYLHQQLLNVPEDEMETYLELHSNDAADPGIIMENVGNDPSFDLSTISEPVNK